jgi:hypothetical protein
MTDQTNSTEDKKNHTENLNGGDGNQGTTNQTDPRYDDSFVNKVLTEKKNAMDRVRNLENELKEIREAELRKTENYKVLAEQKDQELNDLKNKYAQKEQFITENIKKTAIRDELTKLGCKAEFLDKATKLVNINNVEFDSETQTVTGHIEAAKKLSEELRPLFGNAGVGTNQSAPEGGQGQLTLEAWKKLPYDERKKRQGELEENLGIQRRR